MSKLLFGIFIINSILWFVKRLYPAYTVTIRLKIIGIVGISAFSIIDVFLSLVRSVLLLISAKYIYFWGYYYYYISIAAIVIIGIIFVVLLFGYFSMPFTDPTLENKPKFTLENRKVLVRKLQDSIFVGSVFKIILPIAWMKTFNYRSISVDFIVENIVVIFLYIFTIFVLARAALKTKL